MFWANTVSSSPPAARITYWIETPRKAATTILPAQHVRAVRAGSPAGTQRDLLRPHADPDVAGACPRSARGHVQRAPSWVSADAPSSPRRRCASIRLRDAEEVGHERGARALVEVGRRAGLLDPAAVHHRDRVGHRHGLLLIVRHVDEGDADVLLDALELDLQLLAQAQVQRAERLVEQQRARPVDERAGERDALLLAAGELRRLALGRGGRAGRARAPRRRAARPRPWRPSCARGRRRRSSRRVRCGNSA